MSDDGNYEIMADIGIAKVKVEGEDADRVEELFDDKMEKAIDEYEKHEDDGVSDPSGGFA
jgi:hypothetical protein